MIFGFLLEDDKGLSLGCRGCEKQSSLSMFKPEISQVIDEISLSSGH
jgi:hypothetical protein